MSQKKATTKGGRKGKAAGSQSGIEGRAHGDEEGRMSDIPQQETPARSGARRLLTRQKELSGELWKPVTLDEVERLTDRIIEQDEDGQAHAFISLLNGIVRAHYAAKRGEAIAAEVEMLVAVAVNRAYTKTSHFEDGAAEFALLDSAVLGEMEDEGLHAEVWGGGDA